MLLVQQSQALLCHCVATTVLGVLKDLSEALRAVSGRAETKAQNR